jgi:hypothetical protein
MRLFPWQKCENGLIEEFLPTSEEIGSYIENSVNRKQAEADIRGYQNMPSIFVPSGAFIGTRKDGSTYRCPSTPWRKR